MGKPTKYEILLRKAEARKRKKAAKKRMKVEAVIRALDGPPKLTDYRSWLTKHLLGSPGVTKVVFLDIEDRVDINWKELQDAKGKKVS